MVSICFCQRQFIVKLESTRNVYYYEFSSRFSREPKQTFSKFFFQFHIQIQLKFGQFHLDLWLLVPQIFETICVIVFELFSCDHTTQAHRNMHRQANENLPSWRREIYLQAALCLIRILSFDISSDETRGLTGHD